MRLKSHVMQVSLFVLIIYAVASISLMIFAIRWAAAHPGFTLNPKAIIGYAVISFLLVVIMAVYHLSSMVRRRKRRSDHPKLSRARFVRAKHRTSQRY